MIDTGSPLITEFLKDHQQFSRLLLEISKLLSQGKIDDARARAGELDVLAGPHIAYEEKELYPRLADLGERSVTEELLIEQHHDALDAVRMLATKIDLSATEIETVKLGIKEALNHVEHCGSLISLMARLGDEEQAESLKALRRLRDEGKKWTEL